MSALAALLVVYIAALSAVSRNPADLPPHGVQLLTQTVNVCTLFVLVVMTKAFNRGCAAGKFTWSWVTLGVLFANLVIRTVVMFSLKDPNDNLQARFTRWDTAAAVAGSLAAFVEIYYALVPRARFRTTFFLLGLLFVVPLITSVPHLFGGKSVEPDAAVLGASARASMAAYDTYDESKGYASRVHVETVDGVMYIAFAGTENKTDAKVDLNIGDVRVPAEWTRASDPAVRAHKGFTELYAKLRSSVVTALLRANTSARLVVMCGHSLGGALATLAALDAASMATKGSQVHLYTFGAPQVGDGAFAELFDSRVPKAVRVVNPFDPVPRSLSAQLVHTKGQYPVTSLTMDFPPASHLMKAYLVAIERPRWLRIAGVFAPLAYIGIAAAVVIAVRHLLFRAPA